MEETLTRDRIYVFKEGVNMLPDNSFIWTNFATNLAQRKQSRMNRLTWVQMENLMNIDNQFPSVNTSRIEEYHQNILLSGYGKSNMLFFLVDVQESLRNSANGLGIVVRIYFGPLHLGH